MIITHCFFYKKYYGMRNDKYYMEKCLVLGQQAEARGNTAVGAILVKDNEIVSEAEESVNTKQDITCHAEIEAIRFAVHKLGTINLSECVLYSTHEPCVMCSYSIRFHRIKKVVYRYEAPYLGGVSSAMSLLTTTRVPGHWSAAPVVVHLKNEVD